MGNKYLEKIASDKKYGTAAGATVGAGAGAAIGLHAGRNIATKPTSNTVKATAKSGEFSAAADKKFKEAKTFKALAANHNVGTTGAQRALVRSGGNQAFRAGERLAEKAKKYQKFVSKTHATQAKAGGKLGALIGAATGAVALGAAGRELSKEAGLSNIGLSVNRFAKGVIGVTGFKDRARQLAKTVGKDAPEVRNLMDKHNAMVSKTRFRAGVGATAIGAYQVGKAQGHKDNDNSFYQ